MSPQYLETDVVVIGAGTAGSYFAWRMGQAGYPPLILEKHPLGTLGAHIDIFHFDEIRFEQFGVPLPEGEELLGYYPDGLAWPPDGDGTKRVEYAFYVMRLPLFIERLQGYAREAGARILERTAFTEVLVEEGRVVGVRAQGEDGPLEIRARLVVDASGIDGVVRTQLPPELAVETDSITPQDTLYVILQYWDKIEGERPRGLNFYPYHKTFCNPSYGDGAILGIGQAGGYDVAERIQAEFLAERFPHPHHLVRKAQGRTPFRRPPYSLVASGFMVVGDAAFMTKPFSGEGVSSGFAACQIAQEVAAEALRQDDTSREALWPYNVRYFRDQGAKFAGLLAQLPAAAELSRGDVNFLFRQDIIFGSRDFTQMNRDFEVQMSAGRLLEVAGRLLWGVASGQFSRAGLQALLSAMSASGKIRALYERYPEEPGGLRGWAEEADSLWKQAGE